MNAEQIRLEAENVIGKMQSELDEFQKKTGVVIIIEQLPITKFGSQLVAGTGIILKELLLSSRGGGERK